MTRSEDSEHWLPRRGMLKALGAITGLGLASGSAYCAGRLSNLPETSDIDTLARLSGALDARSFGVTMSGRDDDSAALQRAIDAAHRDRKILLIPGGVALLEKPLSLRGRELSILGVGMERTILRASARMDVLIDAREDQDKIVSPFEIEGLSLDGNGMATTVLAIGYRHHTVLKNILCVGGQTGIWERDCWLSRRYNCRVERHRTGWFVERNGHSSLWEGCSFVGCGDVHLALGSGSEPDDASAALLFRSCDIEFGSGAGIRIGKGVVATFDACYVGENIGGIVFDTSGTVSVRGGTLFFGSTPQAALFRTPAGLLRLQDLWINGQAHGTLGTLAAPGGGDGTVDARSISPAFPLAGNPTLPGAPIAAGPVRSAVADQGRSWTGFGRACAVRQEPVDANATAVRCMSIAGGKGQFGLRVPLSGVADVRGNALSIVLVYAASVPLMLQATGPSGDDPAVPPFSQTLGALPATTGRRTYVKLDEKLFDRPFAAIELIADAAAGAWMTLETATIARRSDPMNRTIDLIASVSA